MIDAFWLSKVMTDGVERMLLSVSDRTALTMAPNRPFLPIWVAMPPKPPLALNRLSAAACCQVLARPALSRVVVVVRVPSGATTVVSVVPHSHAHPAPTILRTMGE